MPQAAVRSLARFRIGRRTFYVLPLRSVAYGLISLVMVFAILLVVDRFVLGSLERGGWTAGELWRRHNQLVEENHRRQTTTNECELRHWSGQPLPEGLAGQERGESDRRRILVIGDSFVWGPPYLSLNHFWWRQLAIKLERRGYREVDVLAVGHPGWSTRRQFECAREQIAEVRPDLVIWGYVTNDPDEKVVPKIFDLQDRSPFPQRIRVRLKWLLPNLMFKFESLRAQKLEQQYAGPQYGYTYTDWELQLLKGESFQRYQTTVAEAGELLRQKQTPAFLLTLPNWPCREHFEPRYAPVLPVWEQAGVPVHNTLGEFVSRYGNAPQQGPEAIAWGINPADSHPGPRAAHFHAVMAADILERDYPELLGPKDAAAPHELAINDWLPSELNVLQVDHQNFRLDYPAATDHMPSLPLDKPAVVLSLRYPLALDEVRIAGKGLRRGRIWISTLNSAEDYDEVDFQELGHWSGDSGAFRITTKFAARAVSMIRLQADVASEDRELRLTLIPSAQSEERP